jgi:cardiolipin synthase (CMP-forming)
MNYRRTTTTINVPNILTLVRLLLTPLLVILLVRRQLRPALAIFILAGVSDGLDGLIARWFDQRTVLGAYLDPIADKVLLVSTYVCLAILGAVPDWLTVIVISRDVLIVIGIAVFTLTEKQYGIRPSMLSKLTTVVQIMTVIVSLLVTDMAALRSLQQVLIWMAAALTTASGLHYVYLGMNILQAGEPTDMDR